MTLEGDRRGAVAHAGLDSSAFVRQLASLTQLAAPHTPRSLAERLGDWLAWTDAIALAGVLNGGDAAAGNEARAALASPANATPEACARVRAELERQIHSDKAFSTGPRAHAASHADPGRGQARARTPTLPPPVGALPAAAAARLAALTATAPEDAEAALRQAWARHQRQMGQRIGALRADLRAALATASAEGQRLAALDAVIEQVMAEREAALLAGVPGLLSERLAWLARRRQAPAAAAPSGSPGASPAELPEPPAPPTASAWQSLLLAELALRWQPIEGLLAALQARQTRQAPQAQPADPAPSQAVGRTPGPTQGQTPHQTPA